MSTAWSVTEHMLHSAGGGGVGRLCPCLGGRGYVENLCYEPKAFLKNKSIKNNDKEASMAKVDLRGKNSRR